MCDFSSNKPDVSVIIPIYNVEKYIRECTISLLCQTIRNIEYIFIDDCSTDASIDILEEIITDYPERRSQIKLIRHKENKGVSFTRQEGVLLAQGRWIIHCDSDDFPELDAYSSMCRIGDECGADIVLSGYKRFNSEGRYSIIIPEEHNIKSIDLLNRITGASSNVLHGSLFNKLIRKDLWNNVKFISKNSYCEDVHSLIQILTKNPDLKIEVLSKVCYNYRKREGSLSLLKDDRRETEIISLIDDLEKIREKSHNIYHDAINAKIIGLIYTLLSTTKRLDHLSADYRQYNGSIKINKELNRYKRIFLEESLKGNYRLSKIIRYCNKEGRTFLNLARKIKGEI